MQQSLIKSKLKDTSSASKLSGVSSKPIPQNGTQHLDIQQREIQDVFQIAWLKFKKRIEDDWPLNNLFNHLIMVVLVGLAIGLSNVELSWGSINIIRPLKQSIAHESSLPSLGPKNNKMTGEPLTLPVTLNNFENDVFVRGAVPYTSIPDRKSDKEEITIYIVEQGDTAYSIALNYGIAPETILWSNPELEHNPDLLQVGQEVVVLPVNGVYHPVEKGDTLEKIAESYKVEVEAIINYPLNSLDPENPALRRGEWLVVPGGSKPFVPRTVTSYTFTGEIPENALQGTGLYSWPAYGDIFQGYWSSHPGIDIATTLGSPVLAADSGFVIVAGWDNMYGYHVVIDHSNGSQTLYAHLQSYYVEAGENIIQGQQLGEVGSTGNSTGPHLHFEIRQGTIQRNPVGFLP